METQPTHLQPDLHVGSFVSDSEHRQPQAVATGATVMSFGYFFTNRRAAGRRMEWSRDAQMSDRDALTKPCKLIGDW